MNVVWADFIVISVLFISIAVSFMRGLIKELISLVSWVLAAWLGVVLSKPLAGMLTFTSNETIRLFIAFLLIFVPTIFLGAMVNMFVGGFIRKTPFSFSDRILGIIFGIFRGVLILVCLVLLGGLTYLPQRKWWKHSFFMPQLSTLATWGRDILPKQIAQNIDFSPEKRVEKERETVDIDNSEILNKKPLKPKTKRGQ